MLFCTPTQRCRGADRDGLVLEASACGIHFTHVRVRVVGEVQSDPAVSQDVSYDVEVAGEASHEQLEELFAHFDAIAGPESFRFWADAP